MRRCRNGDDECLASIRQRLHAVEGAGAVLLADPRRHGAVTVVDTLESGSVEIAQDADVIASERPRPDDADADRIDVTFSQLRPPRLRPLPGRARMMPRSEAVTNSTNRLTSGSSGHSARICSSA